jgi:hypothetical protein
MVRMGSPSPFQEALDTPSDQVGPSIVASQGSIRGRTAEEEHIPVPHDTSLCDRCRKHSPLMGPSRGEGARITGFRSYRLVRRWSPPDRFSARRWAAFVGPLRAK